jgi:hypothetical protein
VDETQKRVDKLAKLRASKVKRSATEAAQAQAPVTPATAEAAPEAAPEAPANA